MDYAKVTLVSNANDPDEEILIDVYLPFGTVNPPSPNKQEEEENSDQQQQQPQPSPSPPPYYYTGSRFEHGSMIGNVRYKGHVLYGTDLWRMPHNGNWPESGVGLASEFGVGDDGDFCFYRCGWPLTGDITNGVLGYRHAKIGQPFLKIGVGVLVKGSCPACDSTEDYKFNSPYMYAVVPVWNVTQSSPQSVTLYHEASLQQQEVLQAPQQQQQQQQQPYQQNQQNQQQQQQQQQQYQPNYNPYQQQQQQQQQQPQTFLYHYGYQIQKDIRFTSPNVLMVTTTLTNTGQEAFSTVWYSHNFFTCDNVAVGPGYAIELNLTNGSGGGAGNNNHQDRPLYEEPGTWSWSTPLAQYARVSTTTPTPTSALANQENTHGSVHVEMTRALDPGIRIKAEFTKDDVTQGGFVLEGCNTRIATTLHSGNGNNNNPDVENSERLEMYSYSLYVERGTFSPEPQILLHLPPGTSKTWTQRLEISPLVPATGSNSKTKQLSERDIYNQYNSNNYININNNNNNGFFNPMATAALLSPQVSASSASASSNKNNSPMNAGTTSSSSSSSSTSATTTTSLLPSDQLQLQLPEQTVDVMSSSSSLSSSSSSSLDLFKLVLLSGVVGVVLVTMLLVYQTSWSPMARKRRLYTSIRDLDGEQDVKEEDCEADSGNTIFNGHGESAAATTTTAKFCSAEEKKNCNHHDHNSKIHTVV
ncbi:hypothetical protein ACA910_019052 [Epithemia clementina (nom. ined.)]